MPKEPFLGCVYVQNWHVWALLKICLVGFPEILPVIQAWVKMIVFFRKIFVTAQIGAFRPIIACRFSSGKHQKMLFWVLVKPL